MKLARRLVNIPIRGLTGLACHIDHAELARVPLQGPCILLGNHITWLDVPLLMTHLYPRRIIGLTKVEAWRNPFMGGLMNAWESIPLRRGEADMGALHQALALLQEGGLLAVFPEGTRSWHGRMQKGQPGMVLLALHSRAPLLPIVHYGGERLPANLKRLRRTDFHVVVGRPFHVDAGGAQVTRQVRQQMTTEIMYQMAALLPPAYRGCYSDLSAATETYLRFPPGSASNLLGRNY